MASAALQPATQATGIEPGFDDAWNTECDGQNDGREVTLEHYLHNIYNPDCDYVDGHVEERNLGEFDHGDLQTEIAHFFRLNAAEWQAKAVVEVRLQVSPTRFRIPDVMVLHPGQQRTQIIREAPLVCIEVLSPEDTWKRLKEKVDEYVALGVQNIWAFDPSTRQAFRCDLDGFHRVTADSITVPGTPISIDLTELFSVLGK